MRISLRAARVSADLTLAKASDAVGICHAALASYEKERTYPTLDLFFRLCKLYNVDYRDIAFPKIEEELNM